MKQRLLLICLLCCTSWGFASTWISHLAYNDITSLTVTPTEVFALSDGNVFSCNKQTEQLHFYSGQDGLTGSSVSHICYDSARDAVLFFYANGSLDIKSANGVYTVSDLYLKQMTASKAVRSSVAVGDMLYLAMPYGVQTYNMAGRKFVDTYYIADEAAETNITSVVLSGRSIYAAGDSVVYASSLDSNLVDYRDWQSLPRVNDSYVHGIAVLGGRLIALWGNQLYSYISGAWTPYLPALSLRQLYQSGSHVLATAQDGLIYDLTLSTTAPVSQSASMATAAYDHLRGDYWLASNAQGLLHSAPTGETVYSINSPLLNLPYRMHYSGQKLFVVPGGRSSTQYNRSACVMMYENGRWSNLSNDWLNYELNLLEGSVPVTARDLMACAADPADPEHFFVAAYGNGLFEISGGHMVRHFTAANSGLYDASEAAPARYTRVDGVQYDEQGNLWMSNSGVGVRVLTLPDTAWLSFSFSDIQGKAFYISTPDQPIRQQNRVWLASVRNPAGLALYEHGGTLTDQSDDRQLFRSQFTNEEGSAFELEYITSSAVDLDGNIWLCSTQGLYYYPASQDFFTETTLLHPGIMPGDAEWLLKDEPVNCLAVDSYNRKWIGTARLGVYVLSADMQYIDAHFTTSNSIMPSNTVLSLAINPVTGAVMIGTGAGLVEYRESDTGLSSDYEDLTTDEFSGMMEGWTFHYAYGGVTELAYASNLIYGLADGAIFSVDTRDEEVRCLSALTGLSGSGVGHIVGDPNGRLLVAYRDGNYDIIRSDGTIVNMTDLKRKQLNGVSKLLHDVVFHNGRAYLAMDFGVLVLNLQKAEISEWYLPMESGYPFLEYITISGDSIYAASADLVYSACLRDNLVDYAFWKTSPRDTRPDIAFGSHICGSLFINGCSYQAAGTRGILRTCDGTEVAFLPDGPAINKPYRMTFLDDKMVMVPGGRFATQNQQNAYVMIYEGGQWHNIDAATIREQAGRPYVMDFTRAAIDPLNPSHYYISAYGFGLYEFQDDHISHIYMPDNSPLTSAVPANPEYTRVDGITTDAEGNVWMLNSSSQKAMHVLSPAGKWASMTLRNGSSTLLIPTPGDILVDANKSNYKWFVSSRDPAGIGLYDDGGTPFQLSDDKTVFRSSFVDGNGKTISPDQIRSIAQDRDGLIWVGTKEGVFYISPSTDYFSSNRVGRVIINRTDGSDLGDYMLGTEQVNGIAVDGGNRLWMATATSGAYLMDLDFSDQHNHQTVYHFTTTNSPLPSDNVLSVAVHPITGEVFFGTEAGLVSFRSDASSPQDDFSSAYVYPNPVRPDYQGLLTVTGLMFDSAIRITDAAGNLVYSCTSNGGTAVWNMRGVDGQRVRPGVYLIFCNSAAGDEESKHTILKVLIM